MNFFSPSLTIHSHCCSLPFIFPFISNSTLSLMSVNGFLFPLQFLIYSHSSPFCYLLSFIYDVGSHSCFLIYFLMFFISLYTLSLTLPLFYFLFSSILEYTTSVHFRFHSLTLPSFSFFFLFSHFRFNSLSPFFVKFF